MPSAVQSRQASSDTVASTSFSSLPPSTPRRPLVRTTFFGLIILGFVGTGVGVYAYYNTFSIWPDELRGDLRAAIKAHRRGERKMAEALYRRALETAQGMSLEKLGKMPLLKVSGISIALGSLLEEQGKLKEAYQIYSESLQYMEEKGKTPEERIRAVALAQRCGDLAAIKEVSEALLPETIPAHVEASSLAEHHLRWSVEELLRLAVSEKDRMEALSNPESGLVLADLELPPWIEGATLGASLEALGQLYASQGRSEYAIPLYVQAINLLMPANKASRTSEPTVAERCRTGILMNNIAQLLTDADKSGSKVDEAATWALKGLDIVGYALRGAGWDGKEGKGFKKIEAGDDARTNEVKGQCWHAEVALLSNLGEIARMKKDDCKAREMFQRAYMKADLYGMREYRSRAAQALSELERTTSPKSK
ncbi:hypothetical protein CBS101457_001975 [Exobasidium rhododendri]|nr:hypothetical protein CBS101457_001975 [Exobasidium rhododendri]